MLDDVWETVSLLGAGESSVGKLKRFGRTSVSDDSLNCSLLVRFKFDKSSDLVL